MIDYKHYLRSPPWQETRGRVLKRDNFRCQFCGSPIDPEVHHIRYTSLGHESDRDLITVCRRCHGRLERYKSSPGDDSTNIVRELLIKSFIKRFKHMDVSAGGKCDFCNYSVIKEYMPCLKNISGVSRISDYFRDRRYERVLECMSQGMTPQEARKRTGIKMRTINKVYNETDVVKRLLRRE